MSGRSSRRWVIGVGFPLSGVFLWLALRKVNWPELGTAFSSIQYLPVSGCIGALFLSIILRGARWRVIAQAPASVNHNFLRATNLGLLANMLFPARAGEVIRVVALSRLLHSTVPRPLASALIDRLVDVFMLIVSASVLFWLLPVGPLLKKWFIVLLILALLITALIILFARSSGWGEALAARLARRWLQRWALQPEVFIAELRLEFRQLLGSWLSLRLLILAIAVLCADYCAVFTLVLAFGLTLPLAAPLLLWVFLLAGSTLPSAPGYVGVYQAAAVWALSFYSVSPAMAVAIATVFQIANLSIVLVIAGPDIPKIVRRVLLVKKPA